jgi:hypothetical protein
MNRLAEGFIAAARFVQQAPYVLFMLPVKPIACEARLTGNKKRLPIRRDGSREDRASPDPPYGLS